MQRTVDDFALSVERNLARPLSQQLADCIRSEIQEGRVVDGTVRFCYVREKTGAILILR